jgi:hypothetical protein
MGRTPLSLLCENINPLQRMEYLTYLLRYSDQSACTTQDCKGKLPLHYLAENMSIAIASCHESRAIDSSDPIYAWKRLVAGHTQVLFCKGHQEEMSLSLLLLTKKNGVFDVDIIGSGVMHMILRASFDCCTSATAGLKLPASATILMTPLSHFLAFFTVALCPTEQETMDVLKQSVSEDNSYIVVDSEGNNVLHMVCLGIQWATQEDTYSTALTIPPGEATHVEGHRLSTAESTDEGIMDHDQEAAVSSQIYHEAFTESTRSQVFLEFLLSTNT